MGRIANYASQLLLNSYVERVRTNLQAAQIQVTSQAKSQDYKGMGFDTSILVTSEVTTDQLVTFQSINSTQVDILSHTESTLASISTTISNFRSTLTSFNSNTITNEQSVRDVQIQAFEAMKSLQGYLNTDIYGRYVFAGNRLSNPPIDMELTTLSDFQDKYDGISLSYPTTFDQHMTDLDIAENGSGVTNWLSFKQDSDGNTATPATGTITASSTQFAKLIVGNVINVTGTANNNGTYEVTAVTGSNTISVKTIMLTNEGPVTTPVITRPDGTEFNTLNFGNLTFARGAATITASTANSLTDLTIGTSFKVTNSTNNNGTYIVTANTGTAVTIKEKKLVDEGLVGTETLNLAASALTFTNNASANDRITGIAGNFSDLKPGMKVVIANSSAGGNNGTFTVSDVASDGSYIDVVETLTTAVATGNETAVVSLADGNIKTAYYYNGDLNSHKHRVSKTREFTIDINGADPAFERAFRAMATIAQGRVGTSGGLTDPANFHRKNDATNLLDLALTTNKTTNPQYDAAHTRNILELVGTLSSQISLTKETNNTHKSLETFFSAKVLDLEKYDQLSAITNMTNFKSALEASYAAMATISGLSLHNYLR